MYIYIYNIKHYAYQFCVSLAARLGRGAGREWSGLGGSSPCTFYSYSRNLSKASNR